MSQGCLLSSFPPRFSILNSFSYICRFFAGSGTSSCCVIRSLTVSPARFVFGWSLRSCVLYKVTQRKHTFLFRDSSARGVSRRSICSRKDNVGLIPFAVGSRSGRGDGRSRGGIQLRGFLFL